MPAGLSGTAGRRNFRTIPNRPPEQPGGAADGILHVVILPTDPGLPVQQEAAMTGPPSISFAISVCEEAVQRLAVVADPLAAAEAERPYAKAQTAGLK